MAKQTENKSPPGPPEPYRVTLNNSTSVWTVDASSAEEAIDSVVAQTKSLRDKRNFRAIPERIAGKPPQAPKGS